MSQTAIFARVNGTLYEGEVFKHIVSKDEAIGLCADIGLTSDDGDSTDIISIEYEWYEIGEGEANTNKFFTDSELLEMYKNKDFNKSINQKGYSLEWVQDTRFGVRYSDLED